MSEPFLGMVILVPYNFAPNGWAFCNGQLLPISQYTALFSLLGTTFGGNGTSNFALPDLRGRVPNSSGQGPGLSFYNLGQVGGTEQVTLTIAQMPSHSHLVNDNDSSAGQTRPLNNFPGKPAAGVYETTSDGSTMNAKMIANTGGSQPFPSLSPYLTMNYCIALTGVFPSRN
jgi:microcystin-dependent protein